MLWLLVEVMLQLMQHVLLLDLIQIKLQWFA